MNERSGKHYIDGPLTLLVFGIFAICIVFMLLAGAGAYKRLSSRDMESYSERTCLQYIATKLRSVQSPDSVDVVDFGDGRALQLTESINGEDYMTCIYSYEGQLMELYCLKGIKAGPRSGERLMETDGIDFSMNDGLVRITMKTADGGEETLLVSVRGGERGAA